jgi:hypothetical protein
LAWRREAQALKGEKARGLPHGESFRGAANVLTDGVEHLTDVAIFNMTPTAAALMWAH